MVAEFLQGPNRYESDVLDFVLPLAKPFENRRHGVRVAESGKGLDGRFPHVCLVVVKTQDEGLKRDLLSDLRQRHEGCVPHVCVTIGKTPHQKRNGRLVSGPA